MITRDVESEVRVLYEKYASLVHKRCRMFLKNDDDAWDATQEVFMRLIRSIESIKKKESIYSWLLSASTNYCISQLRKRQFEQFNEEYHHGNISEKAVPQNKHMLLQDIMKHFLAPWDEKTRLIVIYTYIDGYKQEEIARLTGMGESTIRRYLTRFRKKTGTAELKREDFI